MPEQTWKAFLQECGLPESCVAALVSSGYDSRETFGQAFLDTAALERFIKHFLTILKAAGEVAGDMWDIHPVAGKLRGVWSKCRPTSEPVSVKPSSQALAVPGLLCSQPQKIQAADRCRLKKELESMYSSAVITPATMPALSLLQTIHLQVESKNWEWLPWKRLLSEDALLEMKGRRSQASGNELQLVQALECAAGVYREEWDLDLGPSAMRVQHLLETRSHAYVMCGAGHLGHWNVYVKKFMGYYCKRPSDGFRPPSVQEAEAADRVAMEEAFGLCFGGHDLNDALNHVSMDRDLLRHLLVEKPKVSSRPPLKRPAPFPGGKTRPDKPDKDKRPRNGECWGWREGASPSPEPAAVAGNPAVCAESAKAFRWRLRDGGGVGSDADWGSPREETDVLSALRVEWLRLIHDWHLVPRLLKAVAERSKDAWLSEEEVHILREVLEDVKAGFAVWLDGGLAEAKKQFGDNCAAGRLGVVKKAGSAPRLIGDSSISNANHLCRISEKVEMPSLEDVSQFLSRRQGERWIAFLMDISKAHKRVKVAPKERGFSLFAVLEPGGRMQTDLAVKADAVLSDVRKGWKLLECSRHEARPAVWQDLLRRENGLAWLKFGDWTCDSVKPCAEEKQVAGFFLQLIEARVPVQLVELEQKAVVAAADAFADAREAGLGGWWLPAGSPLEVGQIRWFSFKVQLADLPSWFRPQRQSGQPGSLQAIICALEALAQLILLALQRQDGLVTNAGRVVVRQQCDNLGVVGAAAKGFSMKEPVAAVLQAAAVYCMRERINLRVSHVAGSRNEWADMLSRGAAAYPDFWHRLSAHSRRSLDWQQLLSAKCGSSAEVETLDGVCLKDHEALPEGRGCAPAVIQVCILPDPLREETARLLGCPPSEMELLKEADLQDSCLDLLPDSFGEQLPRLRKLRLSGNKLRLLPRTFGHLPKLQTLQAEGNALLRLPTNFGLLRSLQELQLEENNLEVLPESFGSLESLQRLSLDCNHLRELPESFGELRSLQKRLVVLLSFAPALERTRGSDICMSQSSIVASAPELDEASKLFRMSVDISVADRYFANARGEAGLQALRPKDIPLHVDCEYTKLQRAPTGAPASFRAQLLEEIQSRLVIMHGKPPEGPVKEYRLPRQEDVSRVKVRRTVQRAILDRFACGDLQADAFQLFTGGFDATDEQIRRVIEAYVLPALLPGVLRLVKNELEALPRSFGRLQSLKDLWLSSNSIAELPEQFGSLRALQQLRLGRNALRRLPESFGALAALRILALEENLLDELPDSFENLSSLQVLNLDGNCLREVPSSLCLPSLEKLWIGCNAVRKLPDAALHKLRGLKELSLKCNSLQWLPDSGVLTRENLLEGLPSSLGALKKLRMLWLEDNKLLGLPDSCLEEHSLPALQLVRLRNSGLAAAPEARESAEAVGQPLLKPAGQKFCRACNFPVLRLEKPRSAPAMAGAAGAIVATLRHHKVAIDLQGKGNLDYEVQLEDAPVIKAYYQSEPDKWTQLRVPRAFRAGMHGETVKACTLDALKRWLSYRLQVQVSDIGVVVEEKDQEPHIMWLEHEEISRHGAPFKDDLRIVVCCEGEERDGDVIRSLPPKPAWTLRDSGFGTSSTSTGSSGGSAFCVLQ
ncbi:Protein lap1 [Symbiodinium microadriaticum]|uniref:Protein lap1 n=1 Tax=Symbiodinium microadriaticum TaxID=2951 RepID=A0A1Q9EG03_SYMMI|nr:Protein lap1 [Symbiodinium microadriaticum]